MNTTDVLQMKLIDLLNRPVRYSYINTRRKRTARIHSAGEDGAIVINKYGVVVWVAWGDLEWIE